MTARRFLILSAGMGSGHDAVAAALAARLEDAGHETVQADVLELLPAGIGHRLRAGYRLVVERAPVLYAGIYQVFFRGGPVLARGGGPAPTRSGGPAPTRSGGPAPTRSGGPALRPGSAPLAALAEGRLLELTRRHEADAVVSVFHLAAQITGRLRARKELPVPAAVLMTEFEAHRQWLHPGNDLYLCHTEEIAAGIRRATGCPAAGYGPVVDTRFTGDRSAGAGSAGTGSAGAGSAGTGPGEFPAGAERWRQRLAPDGGPIALLSTGAWGIGSSLGGTATLLHRAGYAPAVLCGTNRRLRERLSGLPGVTALGWVDDMPGLMRAASALVDNAAGQTAMEALATGLPVIGYRPIPGHGADGIRLMARLRLSDYARDADELRGSLRTLTRPGPARERRVAAGRAVFRPGTVAALASLS